MIRETYGPLPLSRLLLTAALLTGAAGRGCERGPGEGVVGPPSRAEGKFKLFIHGEPQVYNPGEMYTVTLKSLGPKFVWFSLWAEGTNGGNPGTLTPYGDWTTSKSGNCPALVTAASTLPKLEASSLWSAPASGCVTFKARVVVEREIWYQEEGPLTYTICENLTGSSDEQQPQVNKACCACEEAKYEVGFEGLWSRQTHPKDFPDKNITKFSDVIGASHTTEYRFWDYGGIASDGLREVAELGSTRTLESELKSQSQHIRTIIKARGIAFPNVTSKTFAVFRVDNKHHLISLVSMIAPSPDWFVGVSGLELCLSNCTWIESKVVNLYPWDAGTDSGVTYLSADNQTEPKDHIRRITSTFPADSRSPFYDQSGDPMKPLAKLYLTRQRLYEKVCENNPSTDTMEEELANSSERANNLFTGTDEGENGFNPDIGPAPYRWSLGPVMGVEGPVVDCKTSEWSDWGHCSVSCGLGYRKKMRQILMNARNGGKACPKKLLKTKKCQAGPCSGSLVADESYLRGLHSEFHNIRRGECVYSEWSSWSHCKPSCGLNSLQERTRRVDLTRSSALCEDRRETRVCNVLPCTSS